MPQSVYKPKQFHIGQHRKPAPITKANFQDHLNATFALQLYKTFAEIPHDAIEVVGINIAVLTTRWGMPVIPPVQNPSLEPVAAELAKGCRIP